MCPIAQSSPALCNSLDCSPPGSSVHGISQARVLEWVAVSFPRESFHPEIKPASLASPSLAGGFFTTMPPRQSTTNYCDLNYLFDRIFLDSKQRELATSRKMTDIISAKNKNLSLITSWSLKIFLMSSVILTNVIFKKHCIVNIWKLKYSPNRVKISNYRFVIWQNHTWAKDPFRKHN